MKYSVVNTGIIPSEKGEEYRETAEDYINMCFLIKQKVRLDIASGNQLDNLHEDTNRIDYDKETTKVKVPEKSKFNKIRRMLPEEFEWIKTRKRLITETKLQHHCVWSYADKITKDECAIYSYTDLDGKYSYDGIPRRYTIEICINRQGKYYVAQTHGRYDRVNSSKMKEYVESLLYKNEEKI